MPRPTHATKASTRKRKNYSPKRIVRELVPSDQPWGCSDWWNERSGECRPIVQAIRTILWEACAQVEESSRAAGMTTETQKTRELQEDQRVKKPPGAGKAALDTKGQAEVLLKKDVCESATRSETTHENPSTPTFGKTVLQNEGGRRYKEGVTTARHVADKSDKASNEVIKDTFSDRGVSDCKSISSREGEESANSSKKRKPEAAVEGGAGRTTTGTVTGKSTAVDAKENEENLRGIATAGGHKSSPDDNGDETTSEQTTMIHATNWGAKACGAANFDDLREDGIKNDNEAVEFARASLRPFEETLAEDKTSATSAKRWGLFHSAWGKRVSTSGNSPWRIVIGGRRQSKQDLNSKYAVCKPSSCWRGDVASCVTTFSRNEEADKESRRRDNRPSLREVGHHIRMVELQHLLLQARDEASSRKGKTIKSLKVPVPSFLPTCNGNGMDENGDARETITTIDLEPILRVIVDDDEGLMFVQDAEEVLDALIGFTALIHQEQHEGWQIEHELCGNIEMLTKDWERSNKFSAQSFVVLCLEEEIPEDEDTPATAKLHSQTKKKAKKPVTSTVKKATPRKRVKRSSKAVTPE